MPLLPRQIRIDCCWLGLVLLPYAVLLIAVPPTGEFPLYDDFDYAASAWHLADRGQLTFSDWPAMTLVTHVAWGALACKLAGNSFAVLRCSMCVLSCLAAIAIYVGFRRQRRAPPLSALAAACFAINPLTVSLEYTFMTDITGAALCTVLIVASPSPRWSSLRRLSGYSVLAGLAYLARETAAMPWIVLLLATGGECLRRRASWRRLLWLAAPAGLMIAAYEFWLREFHKVPYNRSLPSLDWTASMADPQRIPFMLSGLGLALAPLGLVMLVNFLPGARRRWLALPIALGIGSAAAVCTGIDLAPPYRGEVFDLGVRLPEMPVDHVPAALSGPTVPLWGNDVSLFRAATTGIAWLLVAAIGAALFENRRSAIQHPESEATPALPVATMTCLATALLYLVTRGFMDRYLISLIPVALLMLAEQLPARSPSRASLLLGGSAAALIGGAALIGVQDAMTRSRSFWTAAERLLQRGVDPDDIDAGLAFGGMYRFNPLYRGEANRRPFWSALPKAHWQDAVAAVSPLTTNADRPYRISFDNEPGYRSIETVPFQSWCRAGNVRIYQRIE